MISRSKFIKKALLRAILLIAAIGIIYFGITMKNQTQAKQQPVILSYDEIMNTPQIINGKALFHENCSSCHGFKESSGMMLDKIVDSAYDKKVLYAWIRNGDSVIKSGNVYYNELYKQYGIKMTSFPNLTDSALDEIMLYIKAEKIFQSMPKD